MSASEVHMFLLQTLLLQKAKKKPHHAWYLSASMFYGFLPVQKSDDGQFKKHL